MPRVYNIKNQKIMYKRAFQFDGGTLTIENADGKMRVTIADAVGAHVIDVPKGQSAAVAQGFAAGARETQALTPEQEKAIAERYDAANKDKQPF